MLPARLTRWKGASVLIDAAARLARMDACCVLVGATQGREGFARQLRAQAQALGMADRLRLVGHCDDMPAALALADVVVSASLEPEGFGRAVIEAQAMGCLVIATDHGGAAETVEHGVTGWRVPSGDAGALAAALDAALALQPCDRRAVGARARSVFSSFLCGRRFRISSAIASARSGSGSDIRLSGPRTKKPSTPRWGSSRPILVASSHIFGRATSHRVLSDWAIWRRTVGTGSNTRASRRSTSNGPRSPNRRHRSISAEAA